MAEYSSLKVPELKKLLAEKGLPQTGNKADLIARLTDDDNKNAAPDASKDTEAPAAAAPAEAKDTTAEAKTGELVINCPVDGHASALRSPQLLSTLLETSLLMVKFRRKGRRN